MGLTSKRISEKQCSYGTHIVQVSNTQFQYCRDRTLVTEKHPPQLNFAIHLFLIHITQLGRLRNKNLPNALGRLDRLPSPLLGNYSLRSYFV